MSRTHKRVEQNGPLDQQWDIRITLNERKVIVQIPLCYLYETTILVTVIQKVNVRNNYSQTICIQESIQNILFRIFKFIISVFYNVSNQHISVHYTDN